MQSMQLLQIVCIYPDCASLSRTLNQGVCSHMSPIMPASNLQQALMYITCICSGHTLHNAHQFVSH